MAYFKICIITLTFFLSICSCGLFKSYDYIGKRGYDLTKDTTIVKPYEYFSHYKGYTPIFRELTSVNKLDLKINISGFEKTDTIPLVTLFRDFQIAVDDPSAKIVDGQIRFSRGPLQHVIHLNISDSCKCHLSFNYLKEREKKLLKYDLLFFWNVSVLKNGITYSIPARAYYLK